MCTWLAIHPANSKQCQAWHTEKEILKVKYTRNISFPEARKIFESYTAAPGKSYASITKTAGVTVSCVDAATQTDPVLVFFLPNLRERIVSITTLLKGDQNSAYTPETNKISSYEQQVFLESISKIEYAKAVIANLPAVQRANCPGCQTNHSLEVQGVVGWCEGAG